MTLEIALLGPPRVRRDGKAVAFDTRKATALLARLALARRPHSREALCELLWPAGDPDRARGALRRTLSTLRSAIGEEWLETDADSVALRHGPELELDVERFRALSAEGASVRDLENAVNLYSGRLLEGFSVRDSPAFDDWVVSEEGALRRELDSALGRLVADLGQQGDYVPAIAHAERWVEIEPLHEPAHRELIRLHAWSGDRGAALSCYRECVRTLSEELGVPPLPETTALFEQVSDGTLSPPSAPAPPPARRTLPLPSRQLPLVGRSQEVEALQAAAEAGRLVVIEGEAGIGKSRLATELAQTARRAGATVLTARCHDDEAGLPYAPVVHLLRQALETGNAWSRDVPPQRLADAALLLPELAELRAGLPPALSLEGPAAQTRLLEGVASVLAAAASRGEGPGIVLIDDVHAADGGTLDLLGYLGRRLRDLPNLLVLTWRSEAVPPAHPLRRLAADLVREGRATVVRPARLDESQVAELVRMAAPSASATELGRRVYLESEGLPLFVAEYLAALGQEDRVGEAVPAEVRSLLAARLAGVGGIGRQVLGAAAVIGSSFDFDSVRATSGRSDEETVEALEELISQGIVRQAEGEEPVYDFSHQKLRELVYEETSPARRRLLHGRAAAALPRSASNAALAAHHLRLAGADEEAASEHELAARHAASLHAHGDALRHLEAALALGHQDAAALHERMGDLRTLQGEYAGALTNYERAIAQCEPSRRAELQHKAGEVHHRRGEWNRAKTRYRAALEAASEDDPGLRSRIQADLGLTLHRAGEVEGAAALAREALALAEVAGDARARAQVHNMLGVLARSEGALGTAREQLERSLELARALGDHSAQVAALNNLALTRRDDGDIDAALELTARALELCVAQGDRHREAALENNLADLYQADDRPEVAMAHLKRAVTTFAEIDADRETRLPEIWKLVSW